MRPQGCAARTREERAGGAAKDEKGVVCCGEAGQGARRRGCARRVAEGGPGEGAEIELEQVVAGKARRCCARSTEIRSESRAGRSDASGPRVRVRVLKSIGPP